MVNNAWFLFVMFCCVLFTESYSQASPTEKISLTVGSNRTLHLPDALRVHVTRKGIIHLVHDHDESWSLTAIKTGVVAIEVKLKQQDPQVIYVDVRPRSETARTTSGVSHQKSSAECQIGSKKSQYEIHTTVEMIDANDFETSGSHSDISFSLNNSLGVAKIGLESSPSKSKYKRRIIGDPMIHAQACDDFEIKAGGEDEFETKTDQGHLVSAWKPHGLSINMKVIPEDMTTVRVPFAVSLKSPSRDRGAYGLSEVSSSIQINLGMKTLAAAINMSSSSFSEKEPLLISKIPIIGPFFRNIADSQSSSKLLVWLEIHKKKN